MWGIGAIATTVRRGKRIGRAQTQTKYGAASPVKNADKICSAIGNLRAVKAPHDNCKIENAVRKLDAGATA
ncbi:MAG: hypothetical protein NVS3B5_21540 [Sphingomicrobium sp.]